MILGKMQVSPERMIPVAMALVVVGISLLTIGIAWPRFSPPLSRAGIDWNDFFRGVLFGIAIVLEITGVAIAAKAAAAKKRNAL